MPVGNSIAPEVHNENWLKDEFGLACPLEERFSVPRIIRQETEPPHDILPPVRRELSWTIRVLNRLELCLGIKIETGSIDNLQR